MFKIHKMESYQTAKGIYGEAEYRGEYGDYMTAPLGNYDVPDNWPMKPYKRPYGGTPGPPVMYEKPSNPEDEGAGYGFKSAGIKEKNVYFYHSDHLGSTSYITDRDGNATQFVSYKPYGEALVDEHATSFETPWKFNGKELDSETGQYYYGARYYEAELALWYGVDALTERYPSVGGYVYCVGNPVRLVDVDGRKIVIVGDYGESTTYYSNLEYNGYDSFTCVITNILNDIASISNGNRLLSCLSESDNIYTITNTFASVKEALSFVASDCGGELHAGLLMKQINKSSNL